MPPPFASLLFFFFFLIITWRPKEKDGGWASQSKSISSDHIRKRRTMMPRFSARHELNKMKCFVITSYLIVWLISTLCLDFDHSFYGNFLLLLQLLARHWCREQMGHMSYDWISYQRRRPSRGFRLHKRRFSVLRVRFFYVIRFFCKWKFPYEKALKLLKKGRTKRSITRRSSNINERMVLEGRRSISACSSRSYNSSNSFYSEAISDCLEFIKMSALSADANSVAHSP